MVDNSTNKNANAWNNPADHFSKLFTEQVAASYVTGAHALRFGLTISQATLAARPAVDGRRLGRHLQRAAAQRQPQPRQRDAAHSDRSAQRRSRTTAPCSRRISGGSGAPPSAPACAGTGSSARRSPKRCRPAPGTRRSRFSELRRRHQQPRAGLRRAAWPNWKDLSPRARRRLRPVRQREDGDQGQRRALRQRRRPRRRRASPTTRTPR